MEVAADTAIMTTHNFVWAKCACGETLKIIKVEDRIITVQPHKCKKEEKGNEQTA